MTEALTQEALKALDKAKNTISRFTSTCRIMPFMFP